MTPSYILYLGATVLTLSLLSCFWLDVVSRIVYPKWLTDVTESTNHHVAVSGPITVGITNISIHTPTAINHSYYQQWYGSSLPDKKFRVNVHTPCSIPSLLFVWNHKTGGYFKSWMSKITHNCEAPITMIHEFKFKAIKAQCPGPYWTMYDVDTDSVCVSAKESTIQRMIKGTHTSLMGITDTDPSSIIAGVHALHSKRPVHDYVVIMMVRKPLDVILSGYNYHASGKEREWTSMPFLLKDYPLFYCFRDVWNPHEHVLSNTTTMYREYQKGYVDNYRDHDALQKGLYFEFTRFMNCQWPIHLEMYQEIKHNKHHQYRWPLFLRFEWFAEYDYAESIRYLLDQIGEPMHRHRILSQINPLDKCSSGIKNGACNHMSRGKFDKQLQIKLLMDYDERICPLLKNMTLSMDGKWVEMEDYC